MQYSGTNALHLGCLSRRPGPCPARAPSRDPARAGGVKVLGAEQGNASAHAIVAPAHHTRAVRVASRGRAGRGLRAAILPAPVGSRCSGSRASRSHRSAARARRIPSAPILSLHPNTLGALQQSQPRRQNLKSMHCRTRRAKSTQHTIYRSQKIQSQVRTWRSAGSGSKPGDRPGDGSPGLPCAHRGPSV